MQTSLNAAHTDDDDQPFYAEERYARALAARQRLDDELEQILTANREALAQMSPAELLAERNRTVDQVNSLSDEEAKIEEDNDQPTHKRSWALERYILNLAPDSPETLVAKMRLLLQIEAERQFDLEEGTEVLQQAIAYLEAQMAAPPSCVIDEA